MQNDDMVSASEFCAHHKIELSFIQTLNELGLIQTVTVEERLFLPLSQLAPLEKIVRLHYDLDINLEGIETITRLLDRIEEMQKHIVSLTNRLRAYEN
jgi:hypothetical protein